MWVLSSYEGDDCSGRFIVDFWEYLDPEGILFLSTERGHPPILLVSIRDLLSQTHSFVFSSAPPPLLDEEDSRESSGTTSFSYLKRHSRLIYGFAYPLKFLALL